MRKGFTLIELLIVVAIIAILAAIAVPNFLEAQVRAKVSRAKADMRSLALAIESYAVDNNSPPPAIARTSSTFGGAAPATALNGPSVFYAGSEGVSSRFLYVTTPIAYISSVFQDPFINSAVKYALDPSTGAPNLGYDTYDYIDAKSFSQAGDGGIAPFAGTRGASLSSGASWHLVSAGPDKINAFGGARTNNGTDAVQLLGADYDPTNGSVSSGDVVRISAAPGPIYVGGPLPRFHRPRNVQYNFGQLATANEAGN